MKFVLCFFIFQILCVFIDTGIAQRDNYVTASDICLNIGKIPKRDSPKRTIINFLKWYKSNEKRLNEIKVLKGGLQETATYYHVDFEETENYLQELEKSNFVTSTFLNDLRKRFVDLDKHLKMHRQNDGPVEGYDSDLVMKAQDYLDVWENLNSAKTLASRITKNKATIKLKFIHNCKYVYRLTKYGDKWLLDKLDNAFSDN